MQHPHNKIERSVLKIICWTTGILILLIVGGIVGHRLFRKWQERKLVAQANALVNEGDLKRAGLDARRILQINPDSADGARVMARIAERAGVPSAVEWRRRAVDLAPNSGADVLALARAAMRFDDAGNRDYALNHLPESAKNTGEFHAIAADLASGRRDVKEMEEHLRAAVRLEPANKEYQLRLASFELASGDRTMRENGRNTLVQLQAEPTLRRDATRRLAEDALRRNQFDDAVKFARELQDFPDHEFADRLLLLSALHASLDSGFAPMLQQLQADSADKPEQIGELITWLNGHQMPAAAIAWASQLPPNLIGQKAVPIALADSYIAVRDWTGMQRMVKNAKWGSVDFLRHALAARASRELGDATESSAQWNEAVKQIGADSKQALTLAEIVQKWGWRDEAIELLWVASKDPVKGDEALQALYTHFAKIGASQDLYRVLLHRRDFRPNDLNIQNNVAQLSVLLNLNPDEGQRLALDLYQKDPKNPAYVSTYAFALLTHGDNKKALKIFNELTDQQLHQPEIAAYYGLALAGAGEHEKAAEFLALGENARLLPEEHALIEKARRTLARM